MLIAKPIFPFPTSTAPKKIDAGYRRCPGTVAKVNPFCPTLVTVTEVLRLVIGNPAPSGKVVPAVTLIPIDSPGCSCPGGGENATLPQPAPPKNVPEKFPKLAKLFSTADISW